MTRAMALVTVALIAASLGVRAQDKSKNPTTPGPFRSSQITAQAMQSTTTQATTKVQAPLVASAAATPNSSPATSQNGSGEQPREHPATKDRSNSIQGDNSGPAGTDAGAKLPQTSTILPLLGLIGLGSLAAGLFARR